MRTFDVRDAGMKIFKTAIVIEGAELPAYMDTIEYEGELWLVPSWMEALWNGWRIPSRIVSLSRLQHTCSPGGRSGDFTLSLPGASPALTETVDALQANGFVVRERPDIRVDLAAVYPYAESNP
jgi:hypothetical protein